MGKLIIALLIIVVAVWALTGELGSGSSFRLASGEAIEQPSPSQKISEKRIHAGKDGVDIGIENAKIVSFYGTNSMDPVIDETMHAIEVPPGKEGIAEGDIISYRDGGGIVSHRVIRIGEDGDGRYYILKGDNNKFADGKKVRFNDIEGVIVGVIY